MRTRADVSAASRWSSLWAVALLALASQASAASVGAASRERAPSSRRAACCDVELSLDASIALIWRGQEYADAPTFQPRLDVSWGPASGSWSADGAWASQDALGGLIVPAPGGGEVAILAAVYHQSGTSPVVEAGVAYRGPAPLRPYLLLARNLVNDPHGATYGQIGVAPPWRGVDVRAFVGAALDGGAYYSANDRRMIDVGVSLERSFEVARRVSIGLGVTGVHNPEAGASWVVARVGVSLAARSERRGPTLDELVPADTRR